MADQQLLLQALSDFARTLVRRFAIADVLFALNDHVREVLDVSGAGVSLGDENHILRFVTASDATITELERQQELAQNGPCVEAYKSGVWTHSVDLTVETRWPELVPDAVRLGMRSVAALPMQFADGETIGTVNIYHAHAREWPDDDIQAASLLADIAVSYVTNASELERSEIVREQLQRALDSRIVIEQAKGMVASDLGIGVDEAFKRLRHHARSHNSTLQAVADAVVNLGLRLN